MNERIRELAISAGYNPLSPPTFADELNEIFMRKFAELIVKEMCDMMEQAEDDCYHCFEPSERPTEYISWLNEWRKRFEQHFGVEE
jgi:hypothetical protein